MKPRHTYNIEATDLFGGEANYSWVERMNQVNADTPRGALLKFLKARGWRGFRFYDRYGDVVEYRAGLVVIFVSEVSGEE